MKIQIQPSPGKHTHRRSFCERGCGKAQRPWARISTGGDSALRPRGREEGKLTRGDAPSQVSAAAKIRRDRYVAANNEWEGIQDSEVPEGLGVRLSIHRRCKVLDGRMGPIHP